MIQALIFTQEQFKQFPIDADAGGNLESYKQYR